MMFANTRTSVQIVGMILLCLAGFFVDAEATSDPEDRADNSDITLTSPSAPEGSYYHEMNFLRTLVLGTAPFLNPALAERASYAYGFDANEIQAQSSWDWDRAEELYRSGQLRPARKEDGLIFLPRTSPLHNVTLRQTALTWESQDIPVVYITPDNTLFDESGITGTPLVSLDSPPWASIGAVSTVP